MHDSPDIFKFCSSNRDLSFSQPCSKGSDPFRLNKTIGKIDSLQVFILPIELNIRKKRSVGFLTQNWAIPFVVVFFI